MVLSPAACGFDHREMKWKASGGHGRTGQRALCRAGPCISIPVGPTAVSSASRDPSPALRVGDFRGPAVVGFTKGINGGWREAGTEHGVRTRRAECGERAGSAREAESRVVLGVRVDAETEGQEGEHRPSGERDGSPGLAEARRPPGPAGQRARGDSQGRP